MPQRLTDKGSLQFDRQDTPTHTHEADHVTDKTLATPDARHMECRAVRPEDQCNAPSDTLNEGVSRFAGQDWACDALCAQTDPEAFFPGRGDSTMVAKSICQNCGVKDPCLEYALINDVRYGVWGGLSERQRRRLRRA
jgi:WhiB family redox-sensing transcriptional regulator